MTDTPGVAVRLTNKTVRHIAGVPTSSLLLQHIGGAHAAHMWLRTDEGTLVAATQIVEIMGVEDD